MQICKRKILSFAFFFIFSAFFSDAIFAAKPEVKSGEDAKKLRLELVNYAKQFVGCPYVLGAIGPDSFDCSGLIFTCSRESIKYQLPRKTSAIFNFCTEIPDAELEAGDLVFFKTTGNGSVSHVGLYMGRNQFIHCASDGPNTGVIISSLRENYWKTHYFKAGRFLPSSKSKEMSKSDGGEGAGGTGAGAAVASADDEVIEEEFVPSDEASGKKRSERFEKDSKTDSILKKNGKASKFDLEATTFFTWNFFTAENVAFVFHGLDFKAAIRFTKPNPQIFIAFDVNWEYGTGVVQFPIEIGVAFNPYIRLYLGPVFMAGNPKPVSRHFDLDEEEKPIRKMIMPGIIGIEFQSPRIKTKVFDLTIVQDIRYTFYRESDGSMLSFKRGFGNGFVFATGVRTIF